MHERAPLAEPSLRAYPAAMLIATWNVNSVRTRLRRVCAFLERHRPDALCLQELKVTDADFPFDEIRAAGYEAVVHGQKTYNGVGLLARVMPTDVVRGFGDGEDDPQARSVVGIDLHEVDAVERRVRVRQQVRPAL